MDKVWETKALVKMKNSAEAKRLLDRLAVICAPVMGRRGWRVKCLKEFFPSNAGLLGMNVNRGVSIFIRLRPAHDKDTFLPWSDMLGTMVHELTHMAVGSHSAEFYKLMDMVHDEVDKDAGPAGTEKKSISGAIFMTNSNRLGGSESVSRENVSKAASDAALRRRKNSALSASSGQRLGGIVQPLDLLTACDRRQLAADAAERRQKDDLWCNESTVYENYDDEEFYKSDEQLNNSVGERKFESSNPKEENDQNWKCRNCDTINRRQETKCVFCRTSNNPIDHLRLPLDERDIKENISNGSGSVRRRAFGCNCSAPHSSSSTAAVTATGLHQPHFFNPCFTSAGSNDLHSNTSGRSGKRVKPNNTELFVSKEGLSRDGLIDILPNRRSNCKSSSSFSNLAVIDLVDSSSDNETTRGSRGSRSKVQDLGNDSDDVVILDNSHNKFTR
jgi:DNA-dependent metalloprotease WSS1